jgi:iron(III) transport system substrate-binding protein
MALNRRDILGAMAVGLVQQATPQRVDAQSTPDWVRIIVEAKKEATLVFMSSLQSRVLGTVQQAFEAKYGISVKTLSGRPAEVRERVRAAQVAGKQQVDVVFGSEALTTIRYNEDKTVLDVPPVLDAAKEHTLFKTAAPIVPVMTITYGFLVNTNLVKPEDEPRGWYDLLDPKWKGKLLLDDPRTNGAGHIFFVGTFGPDYHQGLAQQNPTLTRETQESYRRVARGEYPVFVPFTLPDITTLVGLPVRAVVPKEGSPYVLYGTSLVRNSPHPNAAVLFASYNSSDEALLAYSKAGFGVGVADVIARMPADIRPIAEAKLLGTTDPRGQDAAFSLAREIYK